MKDIHAKRNTNPSKVRAHQKKNGYWYVIYSQKGMAREFVSCGVKTITELEFKSRSTKADLKAIYSKVKAEIDSYVADANKKIMGGRFESFNDSIEAISVQKVASELLHYKKDLTPKARERYHFFLKLFNGYVNNSPIPLKDINRNFAQNLYDWMIVQKKFHGDGIYSPNTINAWWGTLTTILKFAVQKEYISSFNIDIDKRKNKPPRHAVALTRDELELLKNAPIDPKRQVVKDWFLFSCATGYSIKDSKELKWGDIKEKLVNGNKRYFIDSIRYKTGKKYEVAIPLKAYELLGDRKDNTVKVFNFCSSNAIRFAMANWEKEAGLNKGLTPHSGRATFAVSVQNHHKDIYATSKLLGHSSVIVTQNYLSSYLSLEDKFDIVESLSNSQ